MIALKPHTRVLILIVGLSAFSSHAKSLSAPRVSGETIISQSVAANDLDWNAAPEYSYSETVRKENGSKTERVIMLFGSPYRMLLKVNGKPVSDEDRNREQQKFEEAVSRRRSESPSARADRISSYEKDRRRDHLMMEQLTRAFAFKLSGEKHVLGHEVYNLRATPLSGYQPPNMEARVLTGMKGQLWIDRQSFQWVKVMAQVISPVTIGGFLATVQPGTFFELEKMPVEKDIWLPSHFRVESQSKVLILFQHVTQEDDAYFDYEKTPTQYRVTGQ